MLARAVYCAFFLLILGSASAQTFPTGPVTVVVPAAAGGTMDVLARILCRELEQRAGQPFVVENRAGGDSEIGTRSVEQAPPDGYRLLFRAEGVGSNRDLKGVALVATSPLVLVVPASLPVMNYNDFTSLLRGKPLTFASPGIGTVSHYASEALLQATGAKGAHAPYRGAGPAMADLVAGHVSFMFHSLNAVIPQVRSGHLRAIAVTGGSRDSSLPDVPAFRELGVARLEWTQWVGIFVPRDTPDAIVAAWAQKINQAIINQDLRKRYAELGFTLSNVSGKDFDAYLRSIIQAPPACCASNTCENPKICT
jgi:tripartite-type tricarboxylate transporter receptor subunit TctC